MFIIISNTVKLDRGASSESYNIYYTKYGLFAK
jgi:hypothetical protein